MQRREAGRRLRFQAAPGRTESGSVAAPILGPRSPARCLRGWGSGSRIILRRSNEKASQNDKREIHHADGLALGALRVLLRLVHRPDAFARPLAQQYGALGGGVSHG